MLLPAGWCWARPSQVVAVIPTHRSGGKGMSPALPEHSLPAWVHASREWAFASSRDELGFKSSVIMIGEARAVWCMEQVLSVMKFTVQWPANKLSAGIFSNRDQTRCVCMNLLGPDWREVWQKPDKKLRHYSPIDVKPQGPKVGLNLEAFTAPKTACSEHKQRRKSWWMSDRWGWVADPCDQRKDKTWCL